MMGGDNIMGVWCVESKFTKRVACQRGTYLCSRWWFKWLFL